MKETECTSPLGLGPAGERSANLEPGSNQQLCDLRDRLETNMRDNEAPSQICYMNEIHLLKNGLSQIPPRRARGLVVGLVGPS